MTTLTLKTYKTALNDIIKVDSEQADTIQAILDLGFNQVLSTNAEGLQNNNLGVLSDLVNATGDMRNKLTKVITAYIGDHLKHVVWDKEGKRYTKAKDKKVKITGEYPTYPYYEHDEMGKQGEHKPTFDENKRLASFFQQRNKALSNGSLKGDDLELVKQLEAYTAELKKGLESLSVVERVA